MPGGSEKGDMKVGGCSSKSGGFFSPFLSWSPTPNPAGLIFSPFFFSVFESHAKSFLQGMDWNILLSLFLFKD